MPTDKGLNLRQSLQPYRNWLRDGHNLKPPSGGVQVVADRPAVPASGGLNLRGAAVVAPNHPSSDHPMARSSPAKAVLGRKKVEKVLREFGEGELHSSSGAKVTKKSQAVAIALSEAGLSRKKKGKR